MTVFLLYSSVRINTIPRRPSASGTVTASSVTAGAAFAVFSILISSHIVSDLEKLQPDPVANRNINRHEYGHKKQVFHALPSY